MQLLKKLNLPFLFIFTLFLFTPLSASEKPQQSGVPEIAKLCNDCHGNNGVSEFSDVPTIAGAPVVFLEETLFAYRDKIRPEIKSKFRYGDTSRAPTDMKTIASKLSYEQIVELAEYFSSKPFVAAKQKFDVSLVDQGKAVHWQKCEVCHRANGAEPTANAAILSGQWSPYLDATMKYLKDGRRDTDAGMKKAIRDLSDTEWKALLAFYASQQ